MFAADQSDKVEILCLNKAIHTDTFIMHDYKKLQLSFFFFKEKEYHITCSRLGAVTDSLEMPAVVIVTEALE